MSLEKNFIIIRTNIYSFVEKFFEKLANYFGYPKNPGMPITIDTAYSNIPNRSLTEHYSNWPPVQRPETWFEMIFGTTPKLETIPRYAYENTEEGFYNFYIENYRNLFFIPDFISEFIQIRLNICLDISNLEIIREVLFLWLVIYCQIVILRITISWLLTINPYSFPWIYLIALVDWTEDVMQGFVPSIFGVNLTATIFLGILGAIADSLNHLVFTMPFLPSEGEPIQLIINKEIREVIQFHFLPILWYRYPIPNDIREFWYYQRPDILTYFQTVYKDLEIQFLPDGIV